jgi:predicted HTH domain antitoxin
MTVTVEIPDEFAKQLLAEGQEPSRQALEDMAVEAYRAHRLSGAQLRRLLGISSRYELDGFLKKRGVWLDYTLEDFRREGALTAPLLAESPEEMKTESKTEHDEPR